MSVPNSVIPEALQGEYFDDPILSIPEQETGVFDVLSAGNYGGASAKSSINSIENKLSSNNNILENIILVFSSIS